MVKHSERNNFSQRDIVPFVPEHSVTTVCEAKHLSKHQSFMECPYIKLECV